MGTDLAPLDLAWQACDTFSTSASICVAGVAFSVPPYRDTSGSSASATNGDRFGAAGSCVAGVALSASICVAGVVFSAPP